MKKIKFNYKYLLIFLLSAIFISCSIIGLYSIFSKKTNTFTKINQVSNPIVSNNIGNKVGAIRNWQNNNFSGVGVRNGGFVVLTGTQSATRIDTFGNILWEFDPQNLPSEYSQLKNKKVVEAVQDEGSNFNILYLLLVPIEAPDQKQDFDKQDDSNYISLQNSINKQASIVQIVENVNLYENNIWKPSFFINKIININPKKMVDNYPSTWTKTNPVFKNNQTNASKFFSRDDHPSWYVSSSGQTVSNICSENTNLSDTMVLPWKQYITNLGNMYAKDGILLMFGGNGSIFNDPEALSIGMWKLDFNLENDNYIGIPYAYLLKNLSYEPGSINNFYIWNWNSCYAPIGQTNNYSYVPRLAVGGIQTNISGAANYFLYLSGGITVGQVTNSQSRQEVDTNQNPVASDHNPEYQSQTIQDKRSLQLTGANTVSNPKDTDANSIDPAMLFGTAFNINTLMNIPTKIKINENNDYLFSTALINNNYFDIGGTMAVSAAYATYYFFNKGTTSDGWLNSSTNGDYTNASYNVEISANRKYLPAPFRPTDLSYIGEVKYVLSNTTSTQDILHPNTTNRSTASYSYTLNLLVENAKNYYYPTLSFGYSLKNVGSLTKVQMPSQYIQNSNIYGYAMQVGNSILYLNEPKFDTNNLAFHGASSVTIGNKELLTNGKYAGKNYVNVYNQVTNSWTPFNHNGYGNTIIALIRLGVAQYIRGISCFNDTVSMITKGFKISENPYINTSSNANVEEPRLLWNDFVGLSSTNNNSELLSLWNDHDASTNNYEYFILTSNPKIPEYDFSNISRWTNYPSSLGSTSMPDYFLLSQGTTKAWFNYDDSQVMPANGQKSLQFINMTQTEANKYFVKSNETNNNNQNFDVVLNTRYEQNSKMFFGQISNISRNTSKGISYRYIENVSGINEYSTINELNRMKLLGSGKFVSNLPNEILTNSLGELLEEINLSSITNNLDDTNKKIKILKSKFIKDFFIVDQNPIVGNEIPILGSVIILASNIDYIKQEVLLTAYSWNSLIESYDIMPQTKSTLINNINHSLFTGFSALADWVLPITITIPIVLIALTIGLGCGVGIPLAKHKKSIEIGFELQNQKVNTLTKAVGGVFKKIIDNTNATNMKAKPQMLKASGPKTAPPPKPITKSNATPPPKPASK
ncbi:hypothetical protein [Mycoplasmoides pirum]|uniref:hypothetical protein n=1 Tax=Mycoplasmoides pirum TaxID=2122 RepID=UPI000483482F|nr:hypothetical protein [Mycoplasmoides pirum]